MKVSLIIQKPDRETEVVDFDRPVEITIGRSSQCACSLEFDPMVSRMHAVLLVEPPAVRLKDLNSTNGVIINGELFGGVGHEKLLQPRPLRDGDEVRIGSTLFRVVIGDAESPTKGILPRSAATTMLAPRSVLAPSSESDETENILAATAPNLNCSLPAIPGYRIQRFLGSGRMGAVYQAVSPVSGALAAIKIINPGIVFTRKILDNFNREIEDAKRVSHPHIVKLLDSGAIGDQTVYVISEYVNGEDLSGYLLRLPGRRMPLQTAYRLMLQVVSAVGYGHAHGFVHRDIKPQSVMLSEQGGMLFAKLIDLGLAKCFEDSGMTHGPLNVLTGCESLPYMPPEQLSDFRDVKPTADVFSTAAVFYEMLAGRGPYNFPRSGNGDPAAVVAAGDIVPIDERMPGLPEPLVVIIERCLSVDPEERYKNCSDLLEALENVRV